MHRVSKNKTGYCIKIVLQQSIPGNFAKNQENVGWRIMFDCYCSFFTSLSVILKLRDVPKKCILSMPKWGGHKQPLRRHVKSPAPDIAMVLSESEVAVKARYNTLLGMPRFLRPNNCRLYPLWLLLSSLTEEGSAIRLVGQTHFS